MRNPFDSDDESGSPVKSSSKAAINPFDDDANFKPQAASSRVSKPVNPNHHKIADAKNPFDDDDDDFSRPPAKTQTRSSQKKGFFDEDVSAPVDALQPPESRERSRNQFKDRISASGDAAVKRAQKIKDAGSSQASKLIDGGVSQAHKMKESTYSAFKSNNARKGTVDSRNGHADPQARDELFEGVSVAKATRVRYDDSQFQKQDLEYKSVEDLEGYAIQKSEETTATVQNCLRVAEEIKGDATRTLLSLHEQGEQIRKTHEIAFDIDNNLSRGEKLLGSLGGMFSKTWKPKKGRQISGPAISKNDSFKRRGHHLEQRVALGLNRSNSKGRANHAHHAPLMANKEQTTQHKLELEKAKQDDALSTISDVLDELKFMSLDMGAEVASQNPALDDLDLDVSTLKVRVEGANNRARRLLGR